jgi:hypothetical protein
MAGRGTDIKLGEGVRDLGGLYVLATERHESRRVDRQLRGRCSRQGDPGRSRFLVSLEDDLMRLFSNAGIISSLLEKSFKEGEPLEHPLLNRSIGTAQKRVEGQNYSMRKRLLQYDDVLEPAAPDRSTACATAPSRPPTAAPRSWTSWKRRSTSASRMALPRPAGDADRRAAEAFVYWYVLDLPHAPRPRGHPRAHAYGRPS